MDPFLRLSSSCCIFSFSLFSSFKLLLVLKSDSNVSFSLLLMSTTFSSRERNKLFSYTHSHSLHVQIHTHTYTHTHTHTHSVPSSVSVSPHSLHPQLQSEALPLSTALNSSVMVNTLWSTLYGQHDRKVNTFFSVINRLSYHATY